MHWADAMVSYGRRWTGVTSTRGNYFGNGTGGWEPLSERRLVVSHQEARSPLGTAAPTFSSNVAPQRSMKNSLGFLPTQKDNAAKVGKTQ